MSRRRVGGGSDSRPLPLTPRPSLLTPSASSVVPLTTKPTLPSSLSSSSVHLSRSSDNSGSEVPTSHNRVPTSSSSAQSQAPYNSSQRHHNNNKNPTASNISSDLSSRTVNLKPTVREHHIPVPDTNVPLPGRTGGSSQSPQSTDLRSTSPITRKLPSSTTLTTTSPPVSRPFPPTVTFTSTNSPRPATSILSSASSPLNRLPLSTTLTTTSPPTPRLPSSTTVTTTSAPTSRLLSPTPVSSTPSSSSRIPSSSSQVSYLPSRKPFLNEGYTGTRSCISSGAIPSSTNSVLSSKNASISVLKSSVVSTNIIQSTCSSLISVSSSHSSSRVNNSAALSSSNSSASFSSQPHLPSGLPSTSSSLELSRTSAAATVVSHDTLITSTITDVASASPTTVISVASGSQDTQCSQSPQTHRPSNSKSPRSYHSIDYNKSEDSNKSSTQEIFNEKEESDVTIDSVDQSYSTKVNEGKATESSHRSKPPVVSKHGECNVIEVVSTKKSLKCPISPQVDIIEHTTGRSSSSNVADSHTISPGSNKSVAVSHCSSAPAISSPPSAESRCKNKAVSGRAATVYRVGSSGGGGGSSSVVAGVSGRAVSITATSGPAPHTPSRPASPPSVSITAVLRPQHPPLSAAHHAALSTAAPFSRSSPSPASVQHLSPVSCATQPLMPPQPRMDDGSSDSGVSVSEPRSVSRSSVLSDERSSSAEVKPNTPTPQQHNKSLQQNVSVSASGSGAHANSAAHSFALDHRNNKEVRVWRDPALLSQPEQAVRHIHSLQHPMSYQPHAPPPPHPPPPHHPSPHAVAAAAAAAAAMPPGMGFSHGPQLHLPGLQPPLSAAAAAAAAAYYSPSMWKQLAGVAPPALHPSYHGLLSHPPGATQEDVFRELERSHQDRVNR